MPNGVRPFRQFVVKVHSRCDLACDHCYVYEHADQSWRGRPKVMTDALIARTAARIAEHAAAHRLPQVRVVLHGGEPLLVGREKLRHIARTLRAALDGVSRLDLRMQTNGVRLDDEFCTVLAAEGIRTGVSLDGDRASHDRHRRRADGTGSHEAVVRAVRLLGSTPYRRAFAGLLCTVDVANDPIAVYEALAALDPPRVDFLLPHATWDHPPPSWGEGSTAYADWLIAVFDRWTADGRPVRVRLFESVEAAWAGEAGLTEALGLGTPDLVVVETDGEIEQADWLKTVGDGAPATGFHIDRNSFDEAAAHPGFQARAAGLAGLSATCRACPVVRVCGGGLYGHRHRQGSGFDNPSVYCADLMKLILHMKPARQKTPPRRTHAMSQREFDGLATGHGTDQALSRLAGTQRSMRRRLLAAVHDAAVRDGSQAAIVEPAWRALTALDGPERRAVAAVLDQPYLGVWAVRSLTEAADGGPLGDPGRFAEIALAAAVRAGRSLTLTVPVRTTGVHLPSLGRLVVAGHDSDRVDLAVEHGVLHVVRGNRRCPVLGSGRPEGLRWEASHALPAGGRPVLIEDTDPWRPGSAPESLTAEESARWRELFASAARIVRTEYPEHADGLRHGLLAITPLREADGPLRTDRHAFGALGLGPPSDARHLAVLLVEGVQYIKAGALLDMFTLYDPADRGLHGNPPRMLDALLRDAYAHLAVADLWRRRRPGDREAVGRRAVRREIVQGELDALADSGSLTSAGERLLERMRDTMTLGDGPEPAEAAPAGD